MLKPSYAELIDVLNKETHEDNEITSRYTIVIAVAKRARQIIDGDEPMVEDKKGKPLSTAVDEMFNNKIKIVPENQGTVLNLKAYKNVNNEINLKSNLESLPNISQSNSLESFSLEDFEDDDLDIFQMDEFETDDIDLEEDL